MRTLSIRYWLRGVESGTQFRGRDGRWNPQPIIRARWRHWLWWRVLPVRQWWKHWFGVVRFKRGRFGRWRTTLAVELRLREMWRRR